MDVELYDKRTRTRRTRDVPTGRRGLAQEELTLSRWCQRRGKIGVWTHDVYRRTGPRSYEFIGVAPSDPCASGDEAAVPLHLTVPWP